MARKIFGSPIALILYWGRAPLPNSPPRSWRTLATTAPRIQTRPCSTTDRSRFLAARGARSSTLAGNLWLTNRLIRNLVSYSPAQLAVGGALTPNTSITSTSFESPRDIAFDASANLWIVENQNQTILAYKAATLAAALGHSGQVNPDIIISSPSFGDPRAIAFDGSGDLWLTDATGKLLEFDAADLGMSGTPTPKVIITATPVLTLDGIALSLDFPEGAAFDPAGNLWVANLESDNAGSLAEFTPAQLATSGSPSPAVFLDSDIFGTNIHQPSLLTFGPIP